MPSELEAEKGISDVLIRLVAALAAINVITFLARSTR